MGGIIGTQRAIEVKTKQPNWFSSQGYSVSREFIYGTAAQSEPGIPASESAQSNRAKAPMRTNSVPHAPHSTSSAVTNAPRRSSMSLPPKSGMSISHQHRKSLGSIEPLSMPKTILVGEISSLNITQGKNGPRSMQGTQNGTAPRKKKSVKISEVSAVSSEA
mmetsp:Transcript_26757/g.54535  ORF Transcript_26757/g.54535 Transcript_26757/m.54535 type:complete len:162 (-) Transcript_26757:94-579(-)|eukprot:CAMPEP_0181304094 /NCGR_PEP_ID=MMETSP1101-20121128/8945_1 /TAXON_ID=46948 /ORGANISM="Rhodomonas abbreviata, Strain Caron Lab Isolate" /LENGTH=161 /DNA_ID=CAMNT_0023409785 /DNA_START=127 /DNA_END=612 /DNA_ORIENTATION=+